MDRSHRPRIAVLLIAAIAHVHWLALYTRNLSEYFGLESLIDVIGVWRTYEMSAVVRPFATGTGIDTFWQGFIFVYEIVAAISTRRRQIRP